MKDIGNCDSLTAFQLKECYELAAQFEKLDAVRDILREKAKKIDFHQDYMSIKDTRHHESEMQIISEAMERIVSGNAAAYGNNEPEYLHKVNTLPGSAEKEYLLALSALRYGGSETQRLEAMHHISKALSYSPNDPRYTALARILQEADE